MCKNIRLFRLYLCPCTRSWIAPIMKISGHIRGVSVCLSLQIASMTLTGLASSLSTQPWVKWMTSEIQGNKRKHAFVHSTASCRVSGRSTLSNIAIFQTRPPHQRCACWDVVLPRACYSGVVHTSATFTFLCWNQNTIPVGACFH